jgi:hypothetical protein
MDWQFIVALIVAIPLILFPAAVVWYSNAGGVYHALKGILTKKASRPENRHEKGDNRRVL